MLISMHNVAKIALVFLTMVSPLSSMNAKHSSDNDAAWSIATAGCIGALGGLVIGGTLCALQKNAEIKDIDYRPLSTLQNLNDHVEDTYETYFKYISNEGIIVDEQSIIGLLTKNKSYNNLKKQLDSLIEQYDSSIAQLKNQLTYWDCSLENRISSAKKELKYAQIYRSKLLALKKLVKQVHPLLELKECINQIYEDYHLHYQDLSSYFIKRNCIADVAKNNLLPALISYWTKGPYCLINYMETLEKHADQLSKALQYYKKTTRRLNDSALTEEAAHVLHQLEKAHASIQKSGEYKEELATQREILHRQKVEAELEEQTRIARKRLDYDRQKMALKKEQLNAQLRTEQHVAMLRLENALRDICQ